jgi:hypothetical protein
VACLQAWREGVVVLGLRVRCLQEGLEAGHWQPQQEQALLEAEARQLLLELGVLVEDSAGCCWHCPSLSLSRQHHHPQNCQRLALQI